jgi:hypothetical protein
VILKLKILISFFSNYIIKYDQKEIFIYGGASKKKKKKIENKNKNKEEFFFYNF